MKKKDVKLTKKLLLIFIVLAIITLAVLLKTNANFKTGNIVTTNNRLIINTNNDLIGADVYLNGNPSGYITNNPHTISGLNTGTYNLKIKKLGYNDYLATLDVRGTLNINAVPTKMTGIMASAIFNDVDVYVDNVYKTRTRESTKQTFIPINPGNHVIRLSKLNYWDHTQNITVTNNNHAYIVGDTMTPITRMIIYSDQSGANVYINNYLAGQTGTLQNPLIILQGINVGENIIRITKQGFRDYTTKVTLNTAQISSIGAILTPQ